MIAELAHIKCSSSGDDHDLLPLILPAQRRGRRARPRHHCPGAVPSSLGTVLPVCPCPQGRGAVSSRVMLENLGAPSPLLSSPGRQVWGVITEGTSPCSSSRSCAQPWIPSAGCSGVPALGSQLDLCHRAASLGRRPAASSRGAVPGGSTQTLLPRRPRAASSARGAGPPGSGWPPPIPTAWGWGVLGSPPQHWGRFWDAPVLHGVPQMWCKGQRSRPTTLGCVCPLCGQCVPCSCTPEPISGD